MKKQSKKKNSKPKGGQANKESYCAGSGSSLNLKKQVDIVNQKTVEAIEKMASDPDITPEKFYKGIAIASEAFKLMNLSIKISERMKKLKGK